MKISKRLYECHFNECGKSFSTSKDLKRHWVVHTGLREFQCSYCKVLFGRKDHKIRHEKSAHLQKSTRDLRKSRIIKGVNSTMGEVKSITTIDHQEQEKMSKQEGTAVNIQNNIKSSGCHDVRLNHLLTGGTVQTSYFIDESIKDIKPKCLNPCKPLFLRQNKPESISNLSFQPSSISLPTNGMIPNILYVL